MRPKSMLKDLPTTYDVTNHLHNKSVKWLAQLKEDIDVRAYIQVFRGPQLTNFYSIQAAPGLISTTADMWTADTTKVDFLGVTGHWIEVKGETWEMRSEVIGFRLVSGDHSGKNLGRYLVGVCDRIAIMNTK